MTARIHVSSSSSMTARIHVSSPHMSGFGHSKESVLPPATHLRSNDDQPQPSTVQSQGVAYWEHSAPWTAVTSRCFLSMRLAALLPCTFRPSRGDSEVHAASKRKLRHRSIVASLDLQLKEQQATPSRKGAGHTP